MSWGWYGEETKRREAEAYFRRHDDQAMDVYKRELKRWFCEAQRVRDIYKFDDTPRGWRDLLVEAMTPGKPSFPLLHDMARMGEVLTIHREVVGYGRTS